jgi:hypothetical protein
VACIAAHSVQFWDTKGIIGLGGVSGSRGSLVSTTFFRDPRRVIDIFVGGPMGGTQSDGAGLTMADHLPNLGAAVSEIARRLNESIRERAKTDGNPIKYDPIKVHVPPIDASGSIDNRIFQMIDISDLAIMDMSGGLLKLADGKSYRERTGPNVMYEVALLHSLGIPTVMMHLEDSEQPFYQNHQYYVQVKNFQTDTLFARLFKYIKNMCENYVREYTHARLNPITLAYDKVALVDISSVTGLATAYFHNFIKVWTGESHSVFNTIYDFIQGDEIAQNIVIFKEGVKIEDLAKIKKVITLRPRTIDEIDRNSKHSIYNRFDDFKKSSGLYFKGFSCINRDEYKRSLPDKGLSSEIRPYGFKFIKDLIIDIPTPLYAMKSVPRYIRTLTDLSMDPNSEGAKAADYDDGLISKFESTVSELKKKNPLPEENHEFMTIEQIFKHLEDSV